MDTRAARRTAEKAARDLIATRAALVGELGVRRADRAQFAAAVADTTTRGRQLVADAEAEAARLIADAQDLARGGEQRYAEAYTAATDGGWAPADLTALGFPPVDAGSPRRRRQGPAVQQPPLARPDPHAGHDRPRTAETPRHRPARAAPAALPGARALTRTPAPAPA